MPIYFDAPWENEVKEVLDRSKGMDPWKLVMFMFLTGLLVLTLISIIRVGYQITVMIMKIMVLLVIAVIEISMISALLYPTKVVHKVTVYVMGFVHRYLIRFLEWRLVNSQLLANLRELWDTSVKERVSAARTEIRDDDQMPDIGSDVHIY
ncbi:TPA_asm: P6 [Populus betacytorhabdovirus 1]|nr:TPA_asm: P6 [Populus betacytorhabdovirus 1]